MDGPFHLLWIGNRALSAKAQVAAILPSIKSTDKREIEIAASLVERGHRAADRGDYDEAERCFYGVFAIHPELAAVWVDYAFCKYANGFEDKLLRASFGEEPEKFDAILSAHPRSSRALIWKGRMLGRLGRHEDALGCYIKAKDLNPDSLYILWNVARVECDGYRNYAGALEVVDTLLRICPEDRFTLQARANLLCSQRKYEEAKGAFDRALAIDPQNSVLLTDKGTTLELLDRPEDARECFELAISIDPGNFVALTNKGVLLQAVGRYYDAARCYDRALEIAPYYSNAYYNKARLMAVQGKGDTSIDLLAEAVRLNPNCVERANDAPEFQPLRRTARFRAIIRHY